MPVPLSPSSIIWYQPTGWEVTAAYRWVDGLVTCGLTACTPDQLRAQRLETSMGKFLPLSLPGTYAQTSLELMCMLPVAMARSSSESVVICNVLPVLFSTMGPTMA